MKNSNNKAAVFILLGQSNAVGHALPMTEEDKVKVPMKNVFGLSRNPNQSFYHDELFWSGYTSAGMNLGEEQDNTYSVANCLAKSWQKEIDSGNPRDLPDLFIVHIAIGAQGVTQKYMWNPDYEKKLVPGSLGTVDISLFPFTAHILSLVKESILKMKKIPEVIGLHWRGGEEDVTVPEDLLKKDLKETYIRIFDGFNSALREKTKICLHKLANTQQCARLDPTGEYSKNLQYINEVFSSLSDENENITVFDVTKTPYFVPDIEGNGIFKGDLVHFTRQVNEWVADEIICQYVSEH